MISPIIDAVESVHEELSARVGKSYGPRSGAAESLLSSNGDYCMSLVYAALFFPEIDFRNGLPMARFATSAGAVPLDCFHVNLVHHSEAEGRTSSLYAALGKVLAEAWNLALAQQGLPGRFAYDDSTGHDVVYAPDSLPSGIAQRHS